MLLSHLSNTPFACNTSSVSLCLLIGLSLAACGKSTSDVTGVASNIRPTSSAGNVIFEKLEIENNSAFVDSKGVGYAYKSGITGDGTVVAFSGLVNADQIRPPTTGGIAVYRGQSRAIAVFDDEFKHAFVGGNDYARSARTADVTIQANLDNGTFKGENGAKQAGGKFTHRFNGKIDKGTLTGEGFLNVGQGISMDSRLEGKMSDDRALLVFEASSPSTAVAGGMDLKRN